MRITNTDGVGGEELLNVEFERASPNADTPTIEVIFEVQYPGGAGGTTAVLVHLSTTQTDTRQPEVLTKEEFRQVYQKAAEFLSERD